MQIVAAEVGTIADFDHGEGWLEISWKDEFGYSASLKIDMDGHCSREMPIRSGLGPPESLVLNRNCLRLRFSVELAAKLELDEIVEFQFEVDDSTFLDLRGFHELWSNV